MENKKKILLTGGAGFIGSNLIPVLLDDDRVELVRIFDNLSTGERGNFKEYLDHPKFEFMWGDIREYNSCMEACQGMDLISHQAALGSIPRSIKAPLTTNNVNITGTLNIFTAAKDCKIKRVVFAASSSTYGDSTTLPKREEIIGDPISPYAVTKLVNELYARVFSRIFDIEFIGLRYFNVFGKKQNPHGAYAAVIPLFINAILEDKPITINGDGEQSRDFTYIKNVVQANVKALFTENPKAVNEIYNVACGQRITINELFYSLKEIAGSDIEPQYRSSRLGDIKHSLADISKAKNLLGYEPTHDVKAGLKEVYEWYRKKLQREKIEASLAEL
ncbi:MAG: SDR family oxidoreductase [Bacteroidota bacterium]